MKKVLIKMALNKATRPDESDDGRFPTAAIDKFYDIDLGYVGLYGALPAARLRQSYDEAIAVPFEVSDLPINLLKPCSIGVFVHIYYTVIAHEIRAYVEQIPVPFDVFITTSSEEKATEIRATFKNFSRGNLTILIVENRGRDLAPFIIGCGSFIDNYDHILHIHSKYSSHDELLSGWRRYLFDQLLGTPEVVASNLLCLQSGAGLVFPDHYHAVRPVLNYGFNFEIMKTLLSRMCIGFSKDIILDFPSGSMFWANSTALKPLLDLNLTLDDFPPENGQIDGTFQHALERSFLYIVEKSGQGWAKVARPLNYDGGGFLIKVTDLISLPSAIARVSRRLLGNRMAAGFEVNYIPEVNKNGLRPDNSQVPRFSLLLPTLKKDKVFGGVSTAIRLFESLCAEMPPGTQSRIISLTDPVDLSDLQSVPGYVIESLDEVESKNLRSVVDMSGAKVAQLSIRNREVFLATAWWTAATGFRILEQQAAFFSKSNPLFYLIQDHEPDFYGWSSRYAAAQATYLQKNMVPIINSEELTNFFVKKYSINNGYCLNYRMNKDIALNLRAFQKKKILIYYGRPSTPRNAFEIIADGICLWQQDDVMGARDWRVVSVGELYSRHKVSHIQNLEIFGKLSLADYGKLLSEASVGISLMISPHPSYPPLEMAEAGLITITNSYDSKDLGLRSNNILSVDIVTAESIAAAIGIAIERAELRIGKVGEIEPIRPILTSLPAFSAANVAGKIADLLGK